MQQRTEFVLPGDERLHYIKMGTGKRLLLAFHGYSNSAALFAPFEKYLGEAYTIISFDLPYHGESNWKGRPLTISDLELLIQTFKQQYQVDKLSLMGYSLGGRICLTIAEHWPQTIDKMVLLSSDGMAFNPFYFFTTRTYLGKHLLRHLVEKPQIYLSMLGLLKRYKLIHESLHTFINGHLQSKKSREFLQNVWGVTNTIIPNISRLKKQLNKYNIPVFIYAGAYDTIIPVKLAVKFSKGLHTTHLTILQCGHRTINTETIPQVAKNLLD